MRDETTHQPVIGRARFNGATFEGGTDFTGVTFTGPADFTDALFTQAVAFDETRFDGLADFRSARFQGPAQFEKAEFASADFARAFFYEDALYTGTRFTRTAALGPLYCAGRVDLSECVFEIPVRINIQAVEVRCRQTRWNASAYLHLHEAAVDLSYSALSAPTAVTADAPSPAMGGVPGAASVGGGDSVRITSIQGVDAAHLVLTDTDLTRCRFIGAFNLDTIRIEGRTAFASVHSPSTPRAAPGCAWRAPAA
ncbi:pentapeptide repeat-containing protein, partial [Streptomyces mirabilis]